MKLPQDLSDELYKPEYTFFIMIINNIIWGILGIILGIIINNIITILCNKFKITILMVQNALQLFLCAFFLSLVQYFFNFFGWSWQNTTPGIFFTSFFFGIQFDIFTNIQHKYITKLKK